MDTFSRYVPVLAKEGLMFSMQRAFTTASRRTWRRSTSALSGLFLLMTTTASAVTSPAIPTGDRNTVAGVEFLGEAVVPTGHEFDETVVGGLSGITYDPTSGSYFAISDARTDARF